MFMHGDFASCNILVSFPQVEYGNADTNPVVTILDWELVGFFPSSGILGPMSHKCSSLTLILVSIICSTSLGIEREIEGLVHCVSVTNS
jgi:hypothetical protein